MTPEFSHRLAVERIGSAGFDITVDANATERAALAVRLQLQAISALTCRFRLRQAVAGTVAAEGWLEAVVTQICVVSLDEFEAPVSDHFVINFVPDGEAGDDIDPESIDEITYDDGMIDLGETAAEQLALALDPWPRKPDAALPDSSADTISSPFAALINRRLPS
jgi:uncharacterized metal-binding protein YceD (DUF177 family)